LVARIIKGQPAVDMRVQQGARDQNDRSCDGTEDEANDPEVFAVSYCGPPCCESHPEHVLFPSTVKFLLGRETKFLGRRGTHGAITTRQYARLVATWIASIGLDPSVFGTHSLRRTKATLIYRRTGNLRAVQLLLGHQKIESTVRYLGIEVDDALAIAEQVDV
jgi:integrase